METNTPASISGEMANQSDTVVDLARQLDRDLFCLLGVSLEVHRVLT